MTVSFDPGWDEEALLDPAVWATIQDVDLFMPSKSELCHIAQEDELQTALDKIGNAMKRGKIIMKNGAQGALAYSKDVHETTPAISVTPIDTTGAGDSFDGGFLFAYTNDMPLKTCLQYGAICGALVTTAVGGATATPTIKEVEQWLSK